MAPYPPGPSPIQALLAELLRRKYTDEARAALGLNVQQPQQQMMQAPPATVNRQALLSGAVGAQTPGPAWASLNQGMVGAQTPVVNPYAMPQPAAPPAYRQPVGQYEMPGRPPGLRTPVNRYAMPQPGSPNHGVVVHGQDPIRPQPQRKPRPRRSPFFPVVLPPPSAHSPGAPPGVFY